MERSSTTEDVSLIAQVELIIVETTVLHALQTATPAMAEDVILAAQASSTMVAALNRARPERPQAEAAA